jgi:Cu(I)/Ag(I) efflux system membrane protein CusA/SilA
LIILLLLYLNFNDFTKVLIVMVTMPFAVVGGIWLIYLLGYNLSVAVMVGFIALAGVATEIGVVMIIYLDHAFEAQRALAGKHVKRGHLQNAIMAGALERVRPIMMTVCAIIAGLVPIMWSTETGARVMKRIAAPMIGGMVSAAVLALIILILYGIWRGRQLRREARHPEIP